MLEVPSVRLEAGVELPEPARAGDAGLDLRSRVALVIPAGGRALVPTGIAIEIPHGYAGLVVPRSGLALRHGVSCLNAPGLVDSGYRGELAVILINTDSDDAFDIQPGDRIAQLVIVAVPAVRLVPVAELSESERGPGGFGHTGLR